MLTPHIKKEPETQVPHQRQWWETPEPGIASPFLQQPPLPPVSPKRRAGALRTGVMVHRCRICHPIESPGGDRAATYHDWTRMTFPAFV